MSADAVVETQLPPVTSKPPDFDRISGMYRWMEWLTFGPFLQRTRCSFLPSLRQHRRALVLGDGDGRFTASLLATNAGVTVDAVDASPAMLRQLRGRACFDRIRTHAADVRIWQPACRNYDLIATHFFLDCLTTEEVVDLASRLHDCAVERATWVISEFAIPPNAYGRLIACPLISALYFAFGLLTSLRIRRLPNYRFALAQSGWSLACERRHLGGLLLSELWQRERAS